MVRLSFQLHRRCRSPLTFFLELKREFGAVARFRIFNERFLLINDPALINEVLVTKQDSFAWFFVIVLNINLPKS